jgi:S-methylmethionine-dependent homocysteine/selenocysteine methylase
MSRYRHDLPQLSGGVFLADGGLETDLIFNKGVEIREFAAHTLLPDTAGREQLAAYFRPFLALANEHDAGFILDSQTWKAHLHWAEALGATEQELRAANRDSIAFIASLRDESADHMRPIVLNGIIGPTCDAYAPETQATAAEAERYHARQIGWLAESEVDLVTATTFPNADEAIGFVRAARDAGLPAVVSFTVETDAHLPTGLPLGDAIRRVDDATDGAAAYFTVNCAHPEHFFHVFDGSDWTRRVRGLRCNASRRSHAELDACTVLDAGDPKEFGRQYRELLARMPWVNVLGGCCGSDLRHVAEVARAALPKRHRTGGH